MTCWRQPAPVSRSCITTLTAKLVAAVIERQLQLVLAQQPRLHNIDSWDGIDAWAAEILRVHSAPGGPFACPLGTMAAELKNDETFRPLLDDAFRRWEAPLARGLQRMQDRGELVADADRTAMTRNDFRARRAHAVLQLKYTTGTSLGTSNAKSPKPTLTATQRNFRHNPRVVEMELIHLMKTATLT
jgi:hypothetical protein